MTNVSALFRSLVIYGLCLPLAVILGYLLANPLALNTMVVVLVVLSVLTLPLLLRWHHAWLIAMWNCTAMLFFIPGKPQVWMGLAAASLAISIVQYTLNRKLKFISVPSVARPLLLLTAVVLVTARLTGGLGTKLFGGENYGGKRYFIVFAAIMGYFAIVSRRIPPKRATLYVALFFLGAGTMAIGNLGGNISPAFNFLFLLFPVMSMTPFLEQNSVIATTSWISRLNGVSFLGVGAFCALLAGYGLRGVLDTNKPWRVCALILTFAVTMLGGFRSMIILMLLTLTVLFYIERLHHTRLLLPVVFGCLVGLGLLMLFAPRLPLTYQRSLSFLPLVPIDPVVKMDAQNSTAWRLNMWQDVLPQVPQHLVVGKGYGFKPEELMYRGWLSTESMEVVGDYHNGPLSVLLPFGIFGSIAFVWLMIAGIRVVYQNYRFGDPAHVHLNTFLFAFFLTKVVFFCTVFGSLHSDLPMLLGLLGLSISLNGGVAKPAVAPQPKMVFNRFKLHPSVGRPAGA